MKPVYMPFTHISETTARMLSALAGAVVVYQPLASRVADSLALLADQGMIEIRTPLTDDEQRLTAALSEFKQWAAQNPGRSTSGAGFVGSQQGKVPFFDETAITKIRSDLRQYGNQQINHDERETVFSARLFLAVAEDNDRANANLDHDLQQFKDLEQGFWDSLIDSDAADFSRQALGGQMWQEDPGARLTEQRIRGWATLAAADAGSLDCLITTSPAVVDTLVEFWGETIPVEQLTSIRLPEMSVDDSPILARVLTDLATRPSLSVDGCESLAALREGGKGDSTAAVTIYAAIDYPPAALIRQMAPGAVSCLEKKSGHPQIHHTLIVLVEPISKSD